MGKLPVVAAGAGVAAAAAGAGSGAAAGAGAGGAAATAGAAAGSGAFEQATRRAPPTKGVMAIKRRRFVNRLMGGLLFPR
jgi:hypothetical protein